MGFSPPSAITLLVSLLQQWTDTVFPVPRGDKAASLDATWRMLARAISGSQANNITDPPLAVFQEEIIQNYHAGRAGNPPVHAIEQRLRDIVAAGMREQFLAVAIREAMEQLIAVHYPFALDQWRLLANNMLPRSWQWGEWDDPNKPVGSHTVLK
jgi:hypothetical protein